MCRRKEEWSVAVLEDNEVLSETDDRYVTLYYIGWSS